MPPTTLFGPASSICARCYTRLARIHSRSFANSNVLSAPKSAAAKQQELVRKLKARTLGKSEPTSKETPQLSDELQRIVARGEAQVANNDFGYLEPAESHHLHIIAHKHNTHVTLTRPDRSPLMSISAGQIGFRKSQRGLYDAAYQLAAYAMGKMQEKGFVQKMNQLEVVFRGFGPGREAFTKALLGTEGKLVRPYVRRVTDATKLKQGGTRARKVRRLG